MDGIDITRYLILDRGALEVGLPENWEVQPEWDRQVGAIIVKDPNDSIQLDVVCWPTGLPDGLTVERFLMSVTADGLKLVRGPESGSRGDLRYTWVEDVYEAADEHRGDEVRTAHCRWYLCTNGRVTGQVRYFYWDDDASWALPTWEAIIETVHLGSGIPLASPFHHWSMKAPD
ncbi:MAG: hypothetical protein GEU99_07520 [Luteitalea sp.]|nr:hypothetical protein [Luteitalea sp.]